MGGYENPPSLPACRFRPDEQGKADHKSNNIFVVRVRLSIRADCPLRFYTEGRFVYLKYLLNFLIEVP